MPIKGRITAEMWVDMQEKKTVDVIIPVSYPDEKLQKILDRLEKQTHPVERIIVINTDESGFPKNLRWPANMEVYHISPTLSTIISDFFLQRCRTTIHLGQTQKRKER